MSTFPISELKTLVAKDEVANYRRMGLVDADMGFVMDGGAELVMVGKAGLIKLMKAAPVGRVEALRRILRNRLVNYDGSPTEGPATMRDLITLDDELELFRNDDGEHKG